MATKKSTGQFMGDAVRNLVKARDIQLTKLNALSKETYGSSSPAMRKSFKDTVVSLDNIQRAIDVLMPISRGSPVTRK